MRWTKDSTRLQEGRRPKPPLWVLSALLMIAVLMTRAELQGLGHPQGPALGSPAASQPTDQGFFRRLVAAAHERTEHQVRYDGSYRSIPYPLGDVPDSIGVCTDLVIRSYRSVGVDLQRRVHEDMKHQFSAYPQIWGLRRPDPNIDHRRVPNLRRFFERSGASLAVSQKGSAYAAGDLVTWRLANGLPHIGLVSEVFIEGTHRPAILHNIGQGPKLEDALFRYAITGHYRYWSE